MRAIVFITGIALLFLYGSCKKCKDMQHVERSYLMTKYFGNYKPGAYWIYLNRDSTKTDSIWVDNFQTNIVEGAQYSCLSGEEVRFDLHSIFLENTHTLQVRIGFEGQDFSRSVFEVRKTAGSYYTYFYTETKDTSFYYKSVELLKFSSFNIWPHDSASTFFEVFQSNNLLFAPGVGLIQYFPTNSIDTFSLTKIVL